MKRSVCIINTGGTLAMERSQKGYRAVAGFLAEQLQRMPELARPEMPSYELLEYDPVIDSSNMTPRHWLQLANDIARLYDRFDGFVIIHGTDTMAHTASALPFMITGLNKPVILTGSQIPLVEVRNDARENLITALMLAADFPIPEVTLFFGNRLLRGCRATKVSANRFTAFDSPNFPPLGTVGTNINVFNHQFRDWDGRPNISITPIQPQAIATFRLFPGVSHQVLDNVLRQPLVALILESYGTGNGPSHDQNLLRVLRDATDRGAVIVSCTQNLHGCVKQSSYDAGSAFQDVGVVSGADMTIEAALAKLQFLFSTHTDIDQITRQIRLDLVGELTAAEETIGSD